MSTDPRPHTSCKSRIGQAPIHLPGGVKCELSSDKMTVSGPKGSVQIDWPNSLGIALDGTSLSIFPMRNGVSSIWGTMRSRVNSLVKGVSVGWSKSAELRGVGRNAEATPDGISLFLGKSHRDVMRFGGRRGSNTIHKDVTIAINKNTGVVFSGVDASVVGDAIAKLVRLRPPEPYKLSGIVAEGAIIEKKVGKQKK